MSRFDQVYTNSTYEVRLKAKIFLPLLILEFAAFLAYDVVMVLAGIWVSVALLTVITAVLVGAFLLLMKGRFQVAVLASNSSGLVLLMLNRLVDLNEGTGVVQTVFTLSIVMLVTAVFLSKRTWTVLMGVLIELFIGAVLVLRMSSSDTPITSYVAQFLLVLMATALGVTMQTIFRWVARDLSYQLDQATQASERGRELIGQVADNLDRSDRLSLSASEAASAGVEIERNVHSIKDQILQLNQRFTNSEAALENISQNLGQLARLADKQSGIVSHSGAAVEQMVASIQSVASIIDSRSAESKALRATAEDGRHAIVETGSSIKSVVKHIENVRDITALITGIAEQTNLLAMNAAIEAAHAGEAGRGFSVVADEIRKLAESASQNAATINNTLQTLTGAIVATDQQVEASGDAFQEVSDGIDRVAAAMDEIRASTHELNTGTSEILKSAGDLQAATQGVDVSVREVTEAYRQILSDLKQFSRVISEVALGMDEIGVGATDIREAVSGLTDLSTELKEQTKKLHDAAV